MKVNIQLVREGALIPQYQTEGAAAMDLHACLDEAVVIEPGQQAIIPIGVAIELPIGHEAQVRGRSGLAAKHGIGLTNGVGTIDSDYRGEIKVILINRAELPFIVESGMRIAQMVIAKYEKVELATVAKLGVTTRGAGKFGSTGH